jgi:hypothetical protein
MGKRGWRPRPRQPNRPRDRHVEDYSHHVPSKNAACTAGLTVGSKYPYPSSTITFSMNNWLLVHPEAPQPYWTPASRYVDVRERTLRRVSLDRS